MLLNNLCKYYDSYDSHIYISFRIDKAGRTAVGFSVYWKEHLPDPISSTCSTHVTTWLVGQVRCHYQGLVTA